MICKARAPYCTTASSFEKKRMMGFEKKVKSTITKLIKIALYLAVRKTLCSARSICFAPKFCPTNVAAALLNPQAGKIKNTTFLIAI